MTDEYDPIVDEVRRVRERLFEECDFDIDRYLEKIRGLSDRLRAEYFPTKQPTIELPTSHFDPQTEPMSA